MGPLKPKSLSKKRYVLLVKDAYSKYRWMFTLRDKKAKSVAHHLNILVIQIKQLLGGSAKIQSVRTDNGSEFCNGTVDNWFIKRHIIHEKTAPYSPEENGLVERDFPFIKNKAMMLLKSSGLYDTHRCLWGEGMNHAVFLANRLPAHGISGSPLSMITARPYCYSPIPTFGQQCFMLVPKSMRAGKLDSPSVKGVFIGYSPDRAAKHYRILVNNIVRISKDVRFLKAVSNHERENISDDLDTPEKAVEDLPVEDMPSLELSAVELPTMDPPSLKLSTVELSTEEPPIEGSINAEYEMIEVPTGPDTGLNGGFWNGPIESRRNKPGVRESMSLRMMQMISYAVEKIDSDPKSEKEARLRSDWPQWENAIESELTSMEENKVLTPVRERKLPRGCNPIHTMIILKRKYDTDGKLVKYKARLVALGNYQKFGDSYNETYAPVVGMSVLRSVLANAAARDLEIHGMDVSTAFLNAKLEEEIYLSVRGKIYRASKSIYGLK